MHSTKFAALAFIASAAAYGGVSTGRDATAGPAVVSKAISTKAWRPPLSTAPLSRDDAASFDVAKPDTNFRPKITSEKSSLAPMITIFDARNGCDRKNGEYRGKKSNDEDDKMCVKVAMKKVAPGNAEAVLRNVLGSL